jgi:hypothetical protein
VRRQRASNDLDVATSHGRAPKHDPDRDVFEKGGLLPGPDATLAGPTFEEWLDSTTGPT